VTLQPRLPGHHAEDPLHERGQRRDQEQHF
jgi:hypothetical protein